jgi:hypothetical protein
MTTTLATCRYCGVVCADDDTDTAVELLADHQFRSHPECFCGCGHVRAEHIGTAHFSGACRRCGCTAFISRAASAAEVHAVRHPLTCAELQARLDDIGGILSVACVAHVWSVVLTRDEVPVATARDADLAGALRRVVTMFDEVAGAQG